MNGNGHKTKLFYLMCALFGACFIYFAAVTFMPIPDSGKKYADMVVPFLLGSGVGVMISFNWGYSEGSSEKNALLAKSQTVVMDQASSMPNKPACPLDAQKK